MEMFYLDVWSEGSTATIVCKGELDVATASRLRTAVAEALEGSPARLVLDCSELTLLSAAGISALIDAMRQAKEVGAKFDMSISSRARRILDVVGLWWFGVVDDGVSLDAALEEALKRYAEEARNLVPKGFTPEAN